MKNMEGKSVTILSTQIKMMVGLRYKVRNPKRTGRKRIAVEGFNSFSYNRDRKILVGHIRHIDRSKDQYFELVADPETGEIIHRREEKLSAHIGHGSAKAKIAT